MKFNAYIVRLKHRETSLTATFSVPGKSVAVAAESAESESPSEYVSISTNFKKIGPDLFIAQFKTQVELAFLEKFQLKNRDKEITVLLPVISKYNKRKVTKLSKLLANPEELERYHILAALSTIEKFLKIDELLHFFSFHREPLIEFLVEMELKQKIKIINFNSLSITSYENFQHYHDELNAILTQCYTGRTQELKLSEIEAKTKLPQSSLFLKYLVRTFGNSFSFRLKKDRIVFRKMALSENEKESLEELSDILKKNKLSVFTIEEVLKLSGLSDKSVNDSLWFLIENEEVVQLNEKFFIVGNELHKILNKLKKYKRNQGELIDIQAFRELTLYTRKYIIAIFEYFDSRHITMRVDNQRKILLGA